MARVTTLARMWWDLMGAPSIEGPCCAVCGATWPLNRHHVVPRSAGRLYRHGVEVPKPTVMLCGSGNASGCHGKAHSGRLHFRWVEVEAVHGGFGRYMRTENATGGHYEVLELEEPVDRLTALGMDGWRAL